MPAAPAVPRPTWTRRVPGWAFALFFVTLIVFTYFAVYYYNRDDLATAAYMAALASVVPLALTFAVYSLRPVWGLAVPLEAPAVAQALEAAAAGKAYHPVSARDGPFAKCASVVRFDEPACTLGFGTLPTPVRLDVVRERTLLIVRSESRDFRAQAALRASLADVLLRSGP